MNLSFFAYIDESEDESFPQATFKTTEIAIPRGERHHIKTENGGYDIIGLDGITYSDEDDLREQVHAILKELGV